MTYKSMAIYFTYILVQNSFDLYKLNYIFLIYKIKTIFKAQKVKIDIMHNTQKTLQHGCDWQNCTSKISVGKANT